MIVIVSNKDLGLVEDSEILVVGSLLEATKLVGSISDLIFYESDENTNDFAANLSLLKEKNVGNLWYVHDNSTKDDLIEMSIIGNGGTYVSDEFFLGDVELIRSLVSSKGEGNQLTTLGGVGVLDDFLNRYLGEDSSPIPTNYLKIVNNAVNQVKDGYLEKSNQLVVLSEKATEVIEDTSLGLRNIKDERENLTKLVEEIKSSVESTPTSVGRGSSVSFFPRVPYRKEKDIIRIKDIGRTPYLLSFVLGFSLYCSKVLNRRPRVIIVEPVGNLLEDIYSSYTWLTSSNQRDSSKYLNEILFTNYPTAGVLTRLLDDITYDTCIVVDRTINSREHILNSKATRSVHYALSSVSYVESLNLKRYSPKLKYFTSVKEGNGSEFTIPLFEYPSNRFERENLYLSECTDMYRILMRKG